MGEEESKREKNIGNRQLLTMSSQIRRDEVGGQEWNWMKGGERKGRPRKGLRKRNMWY